MGLSFRPTTFRDCWKAESSQQQYPKGQVFIVSKWENQYKDELKAISKIGPGSKNYHATQSWKLFLKKAHPSFI